MWLEMRWNLRLRSFEHLRLLWWERLPFGYCNRPQTGSTRDKILWTTCSDPLGYWRRPVRYMAVSYRPMWCLSSPSRLQKSRDRWTSIEQRICMARKTYTPPWIESRHSGRSDMKKERETNNDKSRVVLWSTVSSSSPSSNRVLKYCMHAGWYNTIENTITSSAEV